MAISLKKCRVCGKEYEPCHTAKNNPDVFRWQEVSCSPECGSKYLALIIESRSPKKESIKATVVEHTVIEQDVIDEYIDEDDEMYEEDDTDEVFSNTEYEED